MARLTRWLSRSLSRASARPTPSLRVERLESRDVPATMMVLNTNDSGVGSLRDAITQANDEVTNPGADVIRFAPGMFGQTISLNTVGDGTFGPTALAITSNITLDGLTNYVSGTGVTIARDTAVSNLRLFYVSAAGSLTLQGLTLSGGAAVGGNGGDGNAAGGGGAGMGGAIFNQGTLAITGSTFAGNAATGGTGGNGIGSGINGGAGGGPNGGAAGIPNAAGGGFGGGGGGGGNFGGTGGNGGFGGGGGGRADRQGGLGGVGLGGFGGGNAGSDWGMSGGGGAGMGGAIFNNGGTVTITNSTLAGNAATGGLGGLANGQPNAPSGQGLGGAVFTRNGSVTVLNSTISANTAADGGRGVYALGDAAAAGYTLNNALVGQSDTAVTDVAANAINGGTVSGAGTNNIIRTSTGVTGLTGTLTADPALSALAGNGGPTQTMAIGSGSPAFNAGSNAGATGLTKDQRNTGVGRIDGLTVDIGAYEFDVTPAVTSVTGPANGTYIAGQNLDFTVTFSDNVTVTGVPQIPLTVGGSTVYATYLSGTGTNVLTFRYTVATGDLDTDGIAVVSPVALNGGTIQDATANNAALTFTPPNTAGVLVDAVAPTVSSYTWPANATYVAGQNIDFTVIFSEPVNVTGTPRFPLTIGSSSVFANYVIGSGNTHVSFRYTVQPGDNDSDGIVVNLLQLNGGTISDAAGNDADNTFTYPSTAGVKVDTTPPSVTSVTPPANGSYPAGANLDFTVTFSEAVTVTGVPQIPLTVGGATVYANYQTGTGTSALTFRYTVQPGDTDADGIAVTSPIQLNGGAIRDAATNNAALNFTPPATAGVLVDTTAPVVVSVVRANPDPTNAGSVQFIVTFSENVTGVGTGSFTVTPTGVTGASVTGVSGSGTTYTVTVNTGTGDGTVRLDVNAGGAADAAGNTSAAFTGGQTYAIDKTAPAAPTVTSPASATTVNLTAFSVQGTAEANTLVEVYSDANNNGVIDGGDAVVGSQQLTGGATTYSVSVPLATNAANNFLVRATDAATNASAPADVPTITQDATAAAVTAVTGPADGSYKAGTTLDFILTFNKVMTVTGVPQIPLTIGGTAVNANYVSGSGTSALTFRYTVQAGDTDADGIAVASPIQLNGGTIRDAATNNAALNFTPPATAGVLVDTTAPTVGVALDAGQNPFSSQTTVRFAVTFSEPVTGFDASHVVVGGSAGASQVSVTGSGAGYVVTVSGLNRDGTVNVTVTAAAGSDAAGNASAASGVSPDVRHTTLPTTVLANTAGTGPNGTQVQLLDPTTGQPTRAIDPFPGFTGSVDTASADLTGDGVADVVVGAGMGGAPHVKVFDGATGAELRSFLAFDAGFIGGVHVATGDVTGDGVADIVVAAGTGGAPHVKVFDGATGDVVMSFFAYNPAFTGGVNVAVGDVNGDGRADIVTTPAAGGAPHVEAFDGATGNLLMSFFAYDPMFVGGLNVAVGDTNGDGKADIVTAAGPGGGPHVKVFDGATGAERGSFFAYAPGFAGGVDVAAVDADGDGVADIVTGAGAGGAPHVKVFNGATFAEMDSFLAGDAGFLGGVRVG